MTNMIKKNKLLFFLSLLLIPAATYCMEEKFSKSVIKASPSERYKLFQNLNCPNIEIPLLQENHIFALDQKYFTELKKLDVYGHSLLSLAAISIYAFPHDDKKVLSSEKVSYVDKKEFIQKLRKLGFKPTQKDRKLARKIEQEAGIKHIDNRSDLFD